MTNKPDDVLTNERLEEILAGCEGVTHGPWYHSRKHEDANILGPNFEIGSADRAIAGQMYALTAAHVSRLDPVTVRAMAMLALEALSRRASDGSSGMVKGLGWEPVKGEGVETYEATSVLNGSYRVFVDDDSAAGAIFAEWAVEPDHFCMTYAKRLGRFHDWETAKAAAQSDFETRVRSCLAIQPVSGDGTEPIRHIILGRGEWVAGVYLQDELPSLCFGPAPEPKEPGTKPTEEVAQFATRNGAVVISFGNVAAASRLLDMVKEAMEMKQASIPTTPGATS